MPRSATRYQIMIVSDALLGGLADFYLAGCYITFKEAEKLEAKWRAVFNNKMRRARDAPRAQLYSDVWAPGHTRRHLYAHGLTAVYTAVALAVADGEDLEHRAAARAGLDLTFYRWGCRQETLARGVSSTCKVSSKPRSWPRRIRRASWVRRGCSRLGILSCWASPTGKGLGLT
jgi:hypothetical protein